MPESDKLHLGHRQRLRDTFKKLSASGGLDAMPEHQLLELLLTYSIPRQDTNPLAHRLISAFGSLERVLAADSYELMRIEGVGESTALLIMLAGRLRNAARKDASSRIPLNTPAAAIEFCQAEFINARYEHTVCITLDAKRRVIHTDTVAQGTLSENVIYPRLVAELALRHCAASVILAHNHPSGDAAPSRADIESTKLICTALNGIGIALYDHIIIGSNSSGYVSAYSMTRGAFVPTGDVEEAIAIAAEDNS